MTRPRRSFGKAPRTKKQSGFKAVAPGAFGPTQFEAEVIAVPRGKYGASFPCLHRTSDGMYLKSFLPKRHPVPEVGDLVVVNGKYEEDKEAKFLPKPMRLRITSIRLLGQKSTRHKEWHAALESALVGHSPVRETRTIRRPVIVTGQNTAGETDILKELNETDAQDLPLHIGFPKFEYVDLGSPESIADGMRRAARVDDVRAIVLSRGGALDKWQLLPFSHPAVVQAVAEVAKLIPVIVAVGHAEDSPLCEQVASFSVTAPSAVVRKFLELNKNREDRLLREDAEALRALPRHEHAVHDVRVQAQSIPRSEEPARAINASVQVSTAPGAAVPSAPKGRSLLRHRRLVAVACVLVAVLAGGWVMLRGRGLNASEVAEPPARPLAVAETAAAPVSPPKPVPVAQKKPKPKPKPKPKLPKEGVAESRGTADAGTEWPPAGAAPDALSPVVSFE
ncbi:hypothetical protein DRW03_35640 [Corallococcus sp. H22C18031201]|nr:hypothetical protein DRW03_35640 [Corallococcus sp. H22C18031201]